MSCYETHSEYRTGFSLIEVLLVIAIIGILSSVILASIIQIRESAHLARAKLEFRSMETALQQYYSENGSYPPDANRNIPPGIEEYLSADDWPSATWPGSVYDWDAWDINGDGITDTWQISIRFCPIGAELDECQFPNEDWAENFGVNSSVFYCLEGSCRSHASEESDYPGYCVNCECKEIPNLSGCG